MGLIIKVFIFSIWVENHILPNRLPLRFEEGEQFGQFQSKRHR